MKSRRVKVRINKVEKIKIVCPDDHERKYEELCKLQAEVINELTDMIREQHDFLEMISLQLQTMEITFRSLANSQKAGETTSVIPGREFIYTHTMIEHLSKYVMKTIKEKEDKLLSRMKEEENGI